MLSATVDSGGRLGSFNCAPFLYIFEGVPHITFLTVVNICTCLDFHLALSVESGYFA